MADEPSFHDRRASLRLDMEKELISIQWLNAKGIEQNRDVMCADVSSGGLHFSLEQSIPIDTHITVSFKPRQPLATQRLATVIRSEQQDHGWFDIGLLFSKK